VTFINTLPVHWHWNTFSIPLKVLTVVCVGFVLIRHAQQFGAIQFGRIPEAVGGGEPLQALFVFGPEQRNLAALLGIPQFTSTNVINAQTVQTNATPTTNAAVKATTTNFVAQPSVMSSIVPMQGFYGPVSILMKSEREIVFFIPNAVSKTNLLPNAKMVRTDQLQAIEYLNSR
jgi:hypothetical protein